MYCAVPQQIREYIKFIEFEKYTENVTEGKVLHQLLQRLPRYQAI